MAIQSVKDKLDRQALQFAEEEAVLKQKCQDLRKQEESLKVLKEKLDRLQKGGGTAEKRELMLKEARIEFDRYMRRFIADGKRKRTKTLKPTLDDKVSAFK